jgi:hypothetical protein
MAPQNAGDVDDFLRELDHARRPEVEHLRQAILAAAPELTERIKWNAPSFCVDGDDRVTFRLRPGDRVELIFHRGAKKRSDSDAFAFEDATGLLTWLAPDRGVVAFPDAAATHDATGSVQELVTAWIAATR